MPAAAARTVLREDPGAGGHRVQGPLRMCPEHEAARARHLVPGRSDLGCRGVSAGPALRVRLHAPGRCVDGESLVAGPGSAPRQLPPPLPCPGYGATFSPVAYFFEGRECVVAPRDPVKGLRVAESLARTVPAVAR